MRILDAARERVMWFKRLGVGVSVTRSQEACRVRLGKYQLRLLRREKAPPLEAKAEEDEGGWLGWLS